MPPSPSSLPVNYDSPLELRAFLDSRALGMRKKFGQNFLVNPATRSRLVDALGIQPGDRVWEIGAGLGAMTSGLLAKEARVKAFEIDGAFSLVLKDLFGGNTNFTLVEGDALKTWQGEAASEAAAGTESPFLLGNLPYNIAAALLAGFIEKKKFFSRLVVTVQREVALRMTASPGSKNYSSFSVLCASAYKASPLMVIKGASFYPPPRVDSQGVRLDLLPEKERTCASPLFQPLVRCLFASRRKTIKNNLINFSFSGILRGAKRDVADVAEAALAASGLGGERRAETLGVEDFAALAAALQDCLKNRVGEHGPS